MSQIVNINDSLTFNPTSYTGATNFASENTTYPWSRGYNGSEHTDNYARFQLNASSTTTDCYIYYVFSVSGIPSNATITSVACSARISKNNRVGTSTIQLYSGTTAKGSSVTFSSQNTTGTSVPVTDISSTGTWTLSGLQNARLRITGRRSSTNQTGYIYFFGATLTINYSLQGINYEITSTLSTNAIDSINPAGLTTVFEGGDYELSIYGASIDDIKVEDNGTDVTSSLVQHAISTGGTISSTPGQTYETGFSASGAAFYNQSNTSTSSDARLHDCLGYSAESPNTTNASSSQRWTYVKDGGSNTANGWIFYNFDFSSIPVGSIIDSIEVKVYGARENSTTSDTYMAKVALYSGSTMKSTEQDITSTSNTTLTMTNVGTWTREELQQAKLRFRVAYYGGWIGGITWKVTYTAPSEHPYYWTYTLTNVAADHTIIIGDSIIEIPDEDPQYEYYPITISSINATTTPGRGTVRVVEGTNQTIEIYPSDPLVTLITDNGVDVSSQLVAHGGAISDPVVTTASGASYGFNLNTSTGYYVSTNNGQSSSASVCNVAFNLPVRCLVTIEYINSGEATYDFGVFGKVDTTLSTSGWTASSNSGDTTTDAGLEQLRCNTSQYNSTSPQTLTYEIPAGSHYIQIKYGKDQSTNSGNDSLQWKITNIEPLEANNYYTYTLSNIQQAHSLIFIFGDVTYYFVNSSGSNCRLYPSGSTVALPGDSYQLTIVPDNYSFDVSVTDNNVNVTSSVQKIEQEVTKDGNTYTVVNYVYTLSNIQATHNIGVACLSTSNTYIKLDDRWVTINRVYKKINGAWVLQTDIETALASVEGLVIFEG